jgi:hypothetical protein
MHGLMKLNEYVCKLQAKGKSTDRYRIPALMTGCNPIKKFNKIFHIFRL